MRVSTCLLLFFVPSWSLALQITSSTHFPQHSRRPITTTTTFLCASFKTKTTAARSVEDLKDSILKAAFETKNGIRATVHQKEDMDKLVRQLEELNPTPNPAQSQIVEGTWRVRYSTAPPPSNGQFFGPITGVALQTLDLNRGIYANELLVGGDDEHNPWLSATLLADWDDLENGSDWKVNFQSIAFNILGVSFQKEFDVGTSRIWITTYLDKDMRVVRAGVTEKEAQRMGKSAAVKDYHVFVMTRETETRRLG